MTNTIINKHNENKNTAGNITKRRRHPVYTIIALTALLIISAFLSIMLGSVQLKPADIMRCLTGSDKSSVTYVLIMNIRLPRMIGAIVAGMGLSVAGVILQSVMNNALASPNTIGVNSGAGFCYAVYDIVSTFRKCFLLRCICGRTADYIMYIRTRLLC